MKPTATATVFASGPAYRHEVHTGCHQLLADEPASAGGQDAGPAPYDLVLAGLGACVAITLRMYAERKSWDIGDLKVELQLFKDADGKARVTRRLRTPAVLTAAQQARLLEIAGKTPVTRTLEAGLAMVTEWGGAPE